MFSAESSWLQAAAKSIQRGDSESDRFTPSESGVGEGEHEGRSIAAVRREELDLGGGEVGAALGCLAGELDPSSGVRRDAAILHGCVENGGEHSEGADGHGGGLGALAGGKRCDPCGDLAMADLTDSAVSPGWRDVDAPGSLLRPHRGRLEVLLCGKPCCAEILDEHLGSAARIGDRL